MEDAFNRNLERACAISSSQEEILRRSLFSHSSSSSSSGGSGPGGAPYWISHRAVTMRSASDSHHSSSSSSSSDARSGGGSEVPRSPEAEESLDAGDGGEGSGLPGNGGDRIVGRVRGKKSCVSKTKGAAAGKSEKRSRPLSEESAQEPEESPVVSPPGKVVGKRLGFSRSGKVAVERTRGDGDPRTDPPGVEDEGGDRSANDELAQFRYVKTGVSPLSHSPPELLKDAFRSPKSARGGARNPPQQRSPVAREPADEEVIKGVAVRSPQGSGKGVMGLNSSSPSTPDEADGERGHGSGVSARSHCSPPQGAGPSTSVQLQNSVEPEEDGPPAMGLGTSSPVEIPQQPGEQRAVEKSPSGDAPSLASPTESALGGEDMEIRCSSDLVDLLIKFSKKPDRRLENVDFLEVLAMKGIHIPPPRWWRPGGYGPKKK